MRKNKCKDCGFPQKEKEKKKILEDRKLTCRTCERCEIFKCEDCGKKVGYCELKDIPIYNLGFKHKCGWYGRRKKK